MNCRRGRGPGKAQLEVQRTPFLEGFSISSRFLWCEFSSLSFECEALALDLSPQAAYPVSPVQGAWLADTRRLSFAFPLGGLHGAVILYRTTT